jgi:hypothetical protein
MPPCLTGREAAILDIGFSEVQNLPRDHGFDLFVKEAAAFPA